VVSSTNRPGRGPGTGLGSGRACCFWVCCCRRERPPRKDRWPCAAWACRWADAGGLAGGRRLLTRARALASCDAGRSMHDGIRACVVDRARLVESGCGGFRPWRGDWPGRGARRQSRTGSSDRLSWRSGIRGLRSPATAWRVDCMEGGPPGGWPGVVFCFRNEGTVDRRCVCGRGANPRKRPQPGRQEFPRRPGRCREPTRSSARAI